MRLDYKVKHTGSILLLRQSHRIELHLSSLDSELSCITMLAGPDQGRPEVHRQQGPYHSRQQALAAISAIANELTRLHYSQREVPLIWQVPAQRLVRQNRKQRQQHRVDSRFIPLGQSPERN